MSIQPNKTDILKEILLEEKFAASNKEIVETAVFMDSSVYSDITSLKQLLVDFYSLPLLEQQGYLKHIKEIVNTIEIPNISFLMEKLYDREFSILFIEQNDKLCEYLLEAAIFILSISNETNFRMKAKTVLERGAGRMGRREFSNVGLIERASIREENTSNLIIIEFCKSLFKSSKIAIREKVVKLIEKLASYSSQYERDQKILTFLVSHLNTSQVMRTALALEMLAVTHSYYTPNLLESVIVEHVLKIMKGDNTMLREVAYNVFFRTISVLDPNSVLLDFSATIKYLAESNDPEVISVFIKNFTTIIKKFPINFVKKNLLPRYYGFESSTSLSVKIDLYSSLSKVLIALLVSASHSKPVNFDCVQEGLKIYFNLILHSEDMAPVYRRNILSSNYKDLYEIFVLYGRDLWSYLKYLIYRLEAYADHKTVELVKLSMVGSVFCLGSILGKDILEEEGLKIINSNFLVLKKNTSMTVKMKSLSYVYKLLTEVDLEKRKYFADYYIVLQDDAKKWRIKATICEQIDHLTELFDINEVISFIVPMTIKLCKDDCAKVRKIACSQFYLLFKAVSRKAPEFNFLLVEHAIAMAEDPSFHVRISFVDIFGTLVTQYMYDELVELKSVLYTLANDPVVGVRIRISQLCSSIIGTYNDLEFLNQIIEKLRDFKDKETMRLVYEFDLASKTRKNTSTRARLKRVEI